MNYPLKLKIHSADIYSASILKNKEHQEIKTVMRHAKPNCKSYQKIKNILTDSSRAKFSKAR